MKLLVVFTSAVLLAALIAGGSAECNASCQSFCEFFDAYCVVHPFLPTYGVECSKILEGCRGTCSDVFCPCQAQGQQECASRQDTCLGDGGDNFVCQAQYSSCLTMSSGQCLAQAELSVSGVSLQTLAAEFHMPFAILLDFEED